MITIRSHMIKQRPALYFGGTKIVQKQRDDIRKVLNNLNSFLDGREYFAGKNLTIADISILPTVTSFAVSAFFLSLININLIEIYSRNSDTIWRRIQI